MVSKTFVLAAAAATGASAACTPPYAGQLPPGANPVFTPSQTETPTIGAPFLIKYDGTGLGPKLSFVLGKGPTENVIPQGTIATVDNCGTRSCSFSWTPALSLEPGTTGYGLIMLDDASCKFQYTSQFGLKPKAGGSPSAKPSAAPSAKPSAAPSAVAPPKSGTPPAPSGKPSPPPADDCEEEEEEEDEECDDANPSAPGTGYPTAPGTGHPAPPTGYRPPGNGTSYKNVTNPAPTYTPLQSNDAGRFAISAFGAIVALAASVMVL